MLSSEQIVDIEGGVVDQWTASLATFMSLYLVVTFNVAFFENKANTYINAIAVLVLSVFPFVIIVILSDMREISWMHHVIYEAC
jgi:hypothetical protein